MFKKIILTFGLILGVTAPSFALDAGFEHHALKTPPLSELVGTSPIPVAESYFKCMNESDDDAICSQLVQKVGHDRLMVPLDFFREKCLDNGQNMETCVTVVNHIISRNIFLSTAIRQLALGMERHIDNEFGRGTLWSVFFAPQDALVGTLWALTKKDSWVGPSYAESLKCKEEENKEIQVCMSRILNRRKQELYTLVQNIAILCIDKNRQQYIKIVTDYDKYLTELEDAIAVLDSFTNENKDRKLYIQMSMHDLHIQLLKMLVELRDKEGNIEEGNVEE